MGASPEKGQIFGLEGEGGIPPYMGNPALSRTFVHLFLLSTFPENRSSNLSATGIKSKDNKGNKVTKLDLLGKIWILR